MHCINVIGSLLRVVYKAQIWFRGTLCRGSNRYCRKQRPAATLYATDGGQYGPRQCNLSTMHQFSATAQLKELHRLPVRNSIKFSRDILLQLIRRIVSWNTKLYLASNLQPFTPTRNLECFQPLGKNNWYIWCRGLENKLLESDLLRAFIWK